MIYFDGVGYIASDHSLAELHSFAKTLNISTKFFREFPVPFYFFDVNNSHLLTDIIRHRASLVSHDYLVKIAIKIYSRLN